MYNQHTFTQGEFIKVLFDDIGTITNNAQPSKMLSIPLNNVNLNLVGFKKHFFRDENSSEFYSYGVQQVNMKKVLTVRTQYLFVNQTFFTYEIHVRFKNSSFTKTLLSGQSMPIPDSYNGFKFQIRIQPTSNIQEESEKFF